MPIVTSKVSTNAPENIVGVESVNPNTYQTNVTASTGNHSLGNALKDGQLKKILNTAGAAVTVDVSSLNGAANDELLVQDDGEALLLFFVDEETETSEWYLVGGTGASKS